MSAPMWDEVQAAVEHIIRASGYGPAFGSLRPSDIQIQYPRDDEGAMTVRYIRSVSGDSALADGTGSITVTWARPPKGEDRYPSTVVLYQGPPDIVTFGYQGPDGEEPF